MRQPPLSSSTNTKFIWVFLFLYFSYSFLPILTHPTLPNLNTKASINTLESLLLHEEEVLAIKSKPTEPEHHIIKRDNSDEYEQAEIHQIDKYVSTSKKNEEEEKEEENEEESEEKEKEQVDKDKEDKAKEMPDEIVGEIEEMDVMNEEEVEHKEINLDNKEEEDEKEDISVLVDEEEDDEQEGNADNDVVDSLGFQATKLDESKLVISELPEVDIAEYPRNEEIESKHAAIQEATVKQESAKRSRKKKKEGIPNNK